MSSLSHIRLRHFRSYTALDLDLPAGLVVLSGPNGQGKTNLLEAIYYLGLLRSFRTAQIAALRQWGTGQLFVGAQLSGGDGRGVTLGVAQGKTRHLRVDGHRVTRGSDFINRFLCTALVPEDIEIAKGAAAVRRRFLDITLSQLDAAYLRHLQRYVTALRARNAMLREHVRFGRNAIRAYDVALVGDGAAILTRRVAAVNRLAAEMAELAASSASTLAVTLKYASATLRAAAGQAEAEPDLAAVEAALRDGLERSYERDVQEGVTRVGPHRDDLAIGLGSRPILNSGSEGECRLAALHLRLAAGSLLARAAGPEQPLVVLVDDVLGELDSARRAAVFGLLARAGQVFLACTEVPTGLPSGTPTVLRVAGGAVTS